VDSALTTVGLPVALAVIMFGLGLSLTPADFARVTRYPKAVVVALGCQILLLPLVCFGLVLLFDLDPVLAVGMMLLAASPGGTTANLFSHLFRGDVALNITLTAVNSVIAVVTLPIVTNLAFGYFDPDDTDSVGLHVVESLEVFAIVLVPVAVGMVVRRRSLAFAERMDRPIRVASAVILAVLVLGILAAERDNVAGYLADLALVTMLFCAVSLTVGYVVPRRFGVDHRQSLASSMEIGVHNGTLAIAIAESVLGDVEHLAIPAAVYSLVMFPLATLAGFVLSRRAAPDAQAPA
jgi:BASS family bile acid:Na+ symporter